MSGLGKTLLLMTLLVVLILTLQNILTPTTMAAFSSFERDSCSWGMLVPFDSKKDPNQPDEQCNHVFHPNLLMDKGYGCVVLVDTVKQEEPSIDCFDTGREVNEAIKANGLMNATSVTRQIIWEHPGRGGSYYVLQSTTCDNRGVFRLFDLGMDNKTSSTDIYCPRSDMYFESNYTGNGCVGWQGYYGYIGHECNDKISSFIVRANP